MSYSKPTIWELAQESAAEADQSAPIERSLLFIGNKRGGKSSLINRFVDKSENARPTLALEYSYARKQRADGIKDLCSIWELGGGTLFAANLLEFAITADNLMNMAIFLVVDLSLPEELLVTIDTLLENVRERVEVLLSKPANYLLKESMRQSMYRRIGGNDHVDINELNNVLPVPLVIIGSKYDLFQELDTEQKKNINRLLRLTAHIYGGSLIYATVKSEALINKVKLTTGHLAFGSPMPSLTASFDDNKPLLVPFGADSFEMIGISSLESMKRTFIQSFPQVATKVVIPDNPAKDPNFAERDIDLVRAHKDKELEEYRRQLELWRYGSISS